LNRSFDVSNYDVLYARENMPHVMLDTISLPMTPRVGELLSACRDWQHKAGLETPTAMWRVKEVVHHVNAHGTSLFVVPSILFGNAQETSSVL
jgi:hypothetical protein